MSTRQAYLNSLVIDQFPIFELDGFTKHSGLLQGDFTVVVYKDGVVSSVPVTITEISTSGEYKMSFTPNALGFWLVDVFTAFNNSRRRADYDVLNLNTSGALPFQTFSDTVRDDQGHAIQWVTINVFEADTANLLYSTQTDFDGVFKIPLQGLLANDILVDLEFTGGGIQTFRKTKVSLL